MAVENETVLMKFLEELKTDFKELKSDLKETNKTLNRFIETNNESLTKIQITQSIQGEQIKALTEGIKELKDESKEVKNDIKGRVSIQTYWFLRLITTLIGIVGKFAFFPNP